jgi:uncharacterized protein (TIGR03663 family)
MKKSYLIGIGWIAVAALALFLRVQNLAEMPVHFDEATGARQLAEQLEGESPQFNPTHFHGPWLRVSTAPIAQLRGETNWQSLSVETLRYNPVLAGLLLCFTPWLWRKELGTAGSLTAAALLASSPLIVYYNRIYIHESWLALFGMLACAGIYRFLQQPKYRYGLLCGISIGLMFATKETFAISILAWSFATSVTVWLARKTKAAPALHTCLKPALLAVVVALLTSAYFYTDGFRHPAGYVDAFRTYFAYETTEGHDKPFFYYAHTLVWPKHRLGLWWSEGLIAVLALAALLPAWRRKHERQAIHFVALSFAAHILIYSWIGYKTPWLMLLPWAHACFLGGMAFTRWQSSVRGIRIALSLLLLFTLCWQARQSTYASGRFANDARNPYAYVPTSRDVKRLSSWLETLDVMQTLSPTAVIGSNYWPLPWYLRDLETVGYWPEIEPTFSEFPLVIVMPDQVAAADALLTNSHVRLPRALRDNVALMVYLRKDIWEQWNQEAEDV